MNPVPLEPRRPASIGIVGAGRSRQGLGPFLASWFERAGARVVGVSGRDRGRAEATARELAQQLAHDVAAYDDAHQLAPHVDALVVACPVAGHLAGLDAALAAGIACLCEKPLVAVADTEIALGRCDLFRRRGLLLMENCQWPFTLPALFELHPGLAGVQPEQVAMRLSPAGVGRAMIEDSLSHVLSLVQALVELPPDAAVRDVRQRDRSAAAEHDVVSFAVHWGAHRLAVQLELERVPQQPRPAWYEVDGCRIDRRIGADYAISFASADGRVAAVADPLGRLVQQFVLLQRAGSRAATAPQVGVVELRLRLFRDVLRALA